MWASRYADSTTSDGKSLEEIRPEAPLYVESGVPETEMIQDQGPMANLHDFGGHALKGVIL